MLGILGLLLAIAALIYGAYKGLHTIPLTLLVALVVIFSNGLGVWDGYSVYTASFGSAAANYILLFVTSAAFAKCMDITGAALKVGYTMIARFGARRAVLVTFLIVSLLTLGGVSLFIVVFVVAPICFVIFKGANLPRHLIVAPLYAGCATYTMTCIPGSPQIQNIIPTAYIGTTMTAAPVLGLCCGAFMLLLELLYLNCAEKRARKNGEGFLFPEGFDQSRYQIDESALPPAVSSFLPLVVSLGVIITANALKLPIASNSTKLCCLAMVTAALLTLLLNYRYIAAAPGSSALTTLKTGLGVSALNATSAFAGLAALVGFGAVVSSTAAYSSIVDWLIGLGLNPYWKGVLSTSVISGITASGSAGLRLTYANLAEHFLASGCDLPILHRLTVIACGSLDTLPHVSGLPVVFGVLGLTHKTAYKHVFWTSVVIPSIVVVCATALVVLLGY